jgi:multidrug efflux system outer membrane protein
LLLLPLLAGCLAGPDYERPEIALPGSYERAPERPVASIPWWEGFSDEALDALMVSSLRRNLTIEEAEAALDEAESFITAERSDFFPLIDGQVTADAAEGVSPDASAGLFGALVLDLFGQNRRSLRAAKAQRAASAAALDDARRLTAAGLANAYIELRRTDARIALLDQSLELQAQTLRIVDVRAQAGLAADLDVRRAAADLARTRAQRGPLAASRREADTLIAVLNGEPPSGRLVPVREGSPVPSYQRGPEVGVPADLLRNRPDLREAEAQLIAAVQRIGIEAADLYPSLRLDGLLSTSLTSGNLANETVQRAGALLDIPLVDFGRRRAEVRAARARADQALAFYERTLISALREAEVALITIEAAEAQRSDLAVAVKASEAAFDQLQALYKEGLATLIDVLDAQRQLIASRERFTDSEAFVAQSYVNLYTALGAPAPVEVLPASS